MPRVSESHLRRLKPYLIGKPKRNGEQDMYCPLHEDNKRSASLNVYTGEWYCFAGCGGGGIVDLMRRHGRWVPPGAASHSANSNGRSSSGSIAPIAVPSEVITIGKIEGWHSALMSDDARMDYLLFERGLTEATIKEYKIGFDQDKTVYTIPVFGPKGEIWNVRRYTNRANARTKIWSVEGMRVTELYPVAMLENDKLVLCEGEWDTLLTIQNGYPAITRTAGALKWNPEWTKEFAGKEVYLAQDRDDDGVTGARKIARQLAKVADVRTVELPFPVVPKHGQDLTDFWLNYDVADFEQLLASASSFRPTNEQEAEMPTMTVLDAFDSQKVAKPIRLQVTIKGKKEPGYSLPGKIELSCTRDRGPECEFCPLNSKAGEDTIEISAQDPKILAMLDEKEAVIYKEIMTAYGVPGGKCIKLEVDVKEHQAVEILFARPSVDHGHEQKDGAKASAYKTVKVTSVGRHDTLPNNTVLVTGALYPSPKDARNEFLAWDVERQETSVDRFEVNDEAIKLMKRFQPRLGQRPLKKLSLINRDLAQQVTRIVGRPEMHAMFDLTFHSLLAFKFGGNLERRGWLESICVGDTRTGKSDAATAMVRHYQAGEIVGGEAATLAGLIGGVQQVNQRDWTITWGVIPINDRRIVVIDEVSGLQPEEISKMSDLRASGVAKITKVIQDATLARTRLIWLANPRSGAMSNFTYGVDMLQQLIGQPEDIARFDLAMAVSMYDIDPSEYNRPIEPVELRYTSEACHTMLMWCWTREPDQIKWARGAENEVYKLANEMGSRYVEQPPLVQAANIRIKIARVAVALAARTFSTDRTGENVIVDKTHVQDAVSFMDRIYSMETFGYAERSRERLADTAEAEANYDDVKTWLLERPQLAKFIRGNSSFRRQDLEEILNIDREMANGMIAKLWNSRMVRKQGAQIMAEPTLHEIIREVRW